MAILIHKDSKWQDDLLALNDLHPSAANHDGDHYYFVSELPSPEYTAIDVDSWVLSGDELAWQVATILTSDKDAVLRLNIYTGDALHNHPSWRIWCANYPDDEAGRKQFKSDWQYIKEMVTEMNPEAVSLWPEYNEQMSYAQGREIIFAAISGFIAQ